MSFLSSLFGDSDQNKPSETKINWIPLTSLEQLDQIEAESKDKQILIFKHSTRCSISKMALKQFEREYDLDDKVKAYFLDLIAHRDVSNEIASRFNVTHQSPQLLLIKDGKSIYNVSHSDIDAEALKSKV
ncbi:bacillithiol system redox-active protein YtxJ [Flavobacterium sp. F-65]|jgi:bacillithiol system protein YtxJ|uniref:Bacillithiol system redox-active protein YtxJ n=1 Tax=Flavobacterium pisciphilum TaxID=2893755 RepID=A0ABS8N1B8_9FLAO|nr:bacillithiol system redox-active protein YtxJ [Flavobacterium sp. F-65]MCC9074186.1 bacillithiol system redox-active protein YtxJ [Flavobacterium sp. F-65]